MQPKDRFPKLWLCDEFYALCSDTPMSEFLPKFSKFDLKYLRLYKQNLSWEGYQILTSSGSLETLIIFSSAIKYSDGTFVTLDKLLQNLRSLKNFQLHESDSDIFKGNTVKNLLKFLLTFKNLKQFHIFQLTETFDFSSFMDYILANETVDIVLKYAYNVPLSDAYVRMLHNFIDQILQNPPKKIPDIYYLDLEDRRQYREYKKLRNGYPS
uniref:Uncharacterized protein n=1 Tax=Panagrolaimus sp. ES5 TaxID=591445 RepID=A0AC34GU50_9BILA